MLLTKSKSNIILNKQNLPRNTKESLIANDKKSINDINKINDL